MATNRILDAIMGKQTQSSQAASSGIGRNIDSQQAAWDQSLKEQPSTFKTWNPDVDTPKTNPLLSFTPEWQEQQAKKKQEQEKPKKKGLFGITIPDGSENPWDYDATNNIIDTSVPATPKKEEPKKVEPPKEEKKKEEPVNPFYTDTMRAIDEAATETSTPTGEESGSFNFNPLLERAWNTIKGSGKQIGSSFTNALGTYFDFMGENGFASNLAAAQMRQNAMAAPNLLNEDYLGMVQDVQNEGDATVKQAAADVQKIADDLGGSAQADLNAAKDGLGKFGQAAVDIGSNVIQMGSDALIGMLTGGSSLFPMAIRVFGQSSQEARQEGATTNQQVGYGLTSAAIETLTEKMADGLAGIYGKGAADDVAEEAIRKLAKTDTGRTILRFMYGANSEGFEEVVSDILNPYAKMIYNNKTLEETFGDGYDPSELLYDYLIGAALGGLGGTVNIAKGGNAEANAALAQTDAVENMLVESGIDAYTAEQVAPTVEKAMNGEELTQKEKNILLEIRNREDVAAGSNEAGNAITETLEQSSISEEQKNAQAEAKEQADAEAEQRAQATAELRALEERASNARAEAERRASEEAEARQQAEETAAERAKATAEANATEEKAAEARAKAEARMKAEAEAKSAADAEARSREIANAERIAEIQQEIADLEQQIPSPERNDEILRLVEERTQLTQENATEEQNAPATEETETIETAPETTQTNEISSNKAAQIETEIDKAEANETAPAVEREITPEMEEAERTANNTSDITEGEQNRIENVLNKTIQAREEASAKAAQTTIPDNTPVDQTKRTTVQTANKADVRKAARSLITEEESSANTVEVSNKLQQLADYVIQNDGSSIDYDAVERMAGDIADTILDGATIEIDSGAKDAGQAVKDYLKTTPLRLDESYRSDVSGDFSDFAKKYRGKIKFSDSGIGVDVAYMELSEMLPGYFPEDITHPADQLVRIADVLDEAEPQLVNRYDVDNMYEQAHAELTSQILDTVLSDVIKQAAPTFADRMYSKLDALKANDAKKLKELREQKNQRMKEIRQQAADAKREAVAKEKAAKWEKVKSVQDYYRNIIERGKKSRKAKELRKKLEGRAKDISDRLTKPKEAHYVPEYFKSAAIELLQDLDFNTGSESKAARIDKLQAAYRQLMADPTYGSIMTDPVWQARLDQVAEYIGGTRVIDMSLEQLQAVYDVVSDLADDINESVKFNAREESKNIFHVGERLLQQTQDAKNWGSGLDSWYSSAALRPTTYFERLGGFVKDSAWKEMGDVLADGQRKEIEQIVKGSQAFADLMNDEETATLRDTVSIGKDAAGNDIEISKGMRAALYMHLLNEDNTRHIKYGGLTIPGIEDYYKGNNDSGFGDSHTRALGISPELAKLQREYREIAKEYQTIDAEENKDAEWQKRIDDVVERMDAKEAEIEALYESGEDYIQNLREKLENDMTPIERRWIDTARKYLDEVQNELNDTTLSVYHFKKALVENYFPIFTDPNFRNTNFESIAKDMSLENSGFMKNRANGANPMLLLDISEVINKYMDKSAKYIGLMPAIRQFNKVYNYTQAGYKDSIKNTIEQKFGKSATKYIEDVIADLTGARKSSNDYLAPFFAKARGHMAQAALSLNPRVALSQAASYMNAASEIGWSPLLKAFNGESNPAKDAAAMDLVTKWSPLEYYRSMGYSTTELGDVKSDSRIENRAMKKLGFAMKWIEMVDTRTVGRLWYAAEAYTQQMNPDLKVGSDEYYQETAKTFNRVVERTQPNYTVMQRPGILRSTSDITKSLTMFMTQRLQNFNILYEAGQRFAQYESDFRDGKNGVTEDDLKQAKTDLANAVTSQIASTAMLVALKAGVDVLLHSVKGYRDKDDKLTTESVMSKIADMYADAMLGNLLGGSEAYALAKSLITHERYYGISLSGVDSLVDLFKDLTNAVNASEGQRAAKWGEVGKSLAQFFGIPVNNGMKIIDGLRYQAEDIINGNFGQFVAGTDYKTAPDTVTDKEGNKYTLDSQAQKTYSDSYVTARDEYYEQFQSSSYYDGLTDDQKKAVENALNNAAKDKAKYDYLKSQGVNEDNPATAHEADMTALKTLGNKANGSFAKNKETNYDTLDYIIKNIYPKLSKAEKDELNSSSYYSRYDNMYDCSRVGIDSKTFNKFLEKARAIDNKSEGATAKAEEYAAYVDTQRGLTANQRAVLKSIYKYSTTIVADTKSYDKWTAAGLSPEDAQGFAKKANADGKGTTPTNKEWFAAIEQYAKDADMAERLWEATGSQTWKKSGKTYLQANPSSKFKGGYVSSGSSSSSGSTGNRLLDAISGSSGSSGTSSSTGNRLLDALGRG